MNDIITVRGIVATEPRHLVTETGLAITSIRVASPSRRWDRSTSAWANGPTNWFTVTAFRSLATNVAKSLNKGDRVIVSGRLRVRSWQRDDRSGTSVEIDAEGIGHDLAWGVATWMRVPRHVRDAQAGPGEYPGVDPVTGEVGAATEHHFGPEHDADRVPEHDAEHDPDGDPEHDPDGGAGASASEPVRPVEPDLDGLHGAETPLSPPEGVDDPDAGGSVAADDLDARLSDTVLERAA